MLPCEWTLSIHNNLLSFKLQHIIRRNLKRQKRSGGKVINRFNPKSFILYCIHETRRNELHRSLRTIYIKKRPSSIWVAMKILLYWWSINWRHKIQYYFCQTLHNCIIYIFVLTTTKIISQLWESEKCWNRTNKFRIKSCFKVW